MIRHMSIIARDPADGRPNPVLIEPVRATQKRILEAGHAKPSPLDNVLRVMPLSVETSLHMRSEGWPPVAGIDGCKHLIPTSWIRAVTRRQTALAPTTEPLRDLIILAQRNDESCRNIANAVGKHGSQQDNRWNLDASGLLRWDNRFYIPNDPALRTEIMKLHHDDPLAGHYGVAKTSQLLRRTYFWEKMEDDIRTYLKECDVCQRIKSKRHAPYGLLVSLPRPSRPWSEISMDFITGLPPCRDPYGGLDLDCILVVVDRYSKMARYLACRKTIDAPELAELLFERVFSLFGVPQGIVSDRGTVFTSKFWSALCFYMHVKQRLSSAYHPQTDGQTERQNQNLEMYLRAFCGTSQKNWATKLPFAEFTYNNSLHQSLQTTPFHVCYGYEPVMPWNPEDRIQGGDVPAARDRIKLLNEQRAELAEAWSRAQQSREAYYNARHLEKHFQIKQWVMLNTKNIRLKTGKLSPKYIGPFQIIKCVGDAAYTLKLPSLYERLHPTFHVSLLEGYVARVGNEPGSFPLGELPELSDEDDLQEWEVESILTHKQIGRSKTRQYLIKWKDFPEDHNTWLPAYPNLENARETLDAYDKNHGLESQMPVAKRRKTSGQPTGKSGKPRRKVGRPRKHRRL
jgi:hypothetical protein